MITSHCVFHTSREGEGRDLICYKNQLSLYYVFYGELCSVCMHDCVCTHPPVHVCVHT